MWNNRRGANDSLDAVSTRDTHWDGVRLHVVTGKGGTGKTTVAAALAIALATGTGTMGGRGRRVLLVEVEGRQGIAQLFDTPPLPYEERKVAVAPDGGEVYALAVDPEEAMLEYLEMFYGLRRAGQALTRLGVIDFATTIAPGLRDVLLTGKASEAVRRRHDGERDDRDNRGGREGREGRFRYDAVVMDAPPTGRITRFLNVNAEVAGLARIGPIHSHADTVMRVIRSPETAVHFVSALEEMPVQETLDGIAELRDVELPVGGVVVNMVRSPQLTGRDLAAAASEGLDAAEIVDGLKAAGLGGVPEDEVTGIARGLIAEASEHARRAVVQQRERDRLGQIRRPRYELPLLSDGIDLAGLYELAELLRTQGAT
jgi:anion-transporting  ArsA/GET3 family ATPase